MFVSGKGVYHSKSGEVPTQHTFRVRRRSARTSDCLCGLVDNPYLEAKGLGAMDYLERLEPRDMAWVVDAQILRGASA
jgi:hypothetical protein